MTTHAPSLARLGAGTLALLLLAGCGGHSPSGGGSRSSAGNPSTQAPQVIAVAPSSGPEAGGTRVTITTAGFAGSFLQTAPTATLGGAPLTAIAAVSTASFEGVVPAGAGDADLVVLHGGEQATLAAAFRYVAGAPEPVVLTSGPKNRGMINVQAPAAGLVLGQVRVECAADATLDRLVAVGDGSIDESAGLGDVVLHEDTNGNGALDAGEPRLGAGGFSSNNGAVSFTGLGLTLSAGAPRDLLIAVEVKAAAALGDVIALRVEGYRAAATNAAGAAVEVVEGAVTGAAQVTDGSAPNTVVIEAAPGNPAATNVAADAAAAPMLAVRLGSPTGSVDVHGIAFRAGGSGDEATDVLSARLAVDLDHDGRIDPTDTALGTARFEANDGLLRFPFSYNQRLGWAGSSLDLVVEYTFAGTAAAGETFSLALASGDDVLAHAYYAPGGQEISLASGPISGGTMTVSGAGGALRLAAQGAPAAVAAPGVETAALALALTAGEGGAASLSAITVRATGSLDDAGEVAGVSLYEDDGDGALGAADVLVAGPLTFSQDDGAVTFALPTAVQGVSAGARRSLLVTATLAASAPVGASLSLLTTGADVTASVPARGEAQGALLLVGAGPSVAVQPGPEVGKDAYLRGEGLYLNDNWGHTGALVVGDRPTGQLGERLFFTEMPLPALPAGAQVERAYVAFYLASTSGLIASSLEVEAHQVIDSGARTPWSEGRGGVDASLDGICYDGTIQGRARPDLSMPDAAPTALGTQTIAAGSAGRWVVFEVTAAAQAWYSGAAPNLGLRLRDRNYLAHVDGEVVFWSSDATDPSRRPIFLVEAR